MHNFCFKNFSVLFRWSQLSAKFSFKIRLKRVLKSYWKITPIKIMQNNTKQFYLQVERILKREPERFHALARCQGHLKFCTFLGLSCWENSSKSFRAAEKSQGADDKNKEKVEANCTGFSAEFFGSQSVEMFCFARKTKIQMLTASSQSLTRIHQRLLKSLGLEQFKFLKWNFRKFLGLNICCMCCSLVKTPPPSRQTDETKRNLTYFVSGKSQL